jgi:ADP-ribosylglycohydrolase
VELKREQVNNSGWAVSTLDAALWAFNTTKSFEDGLIAAVNLGGDSDSIGAVYGQLAGAYYGFDAIPDRWVKAIKTWEKVDALIERFLDAWGAAAAATREIVRPSCNRRSVLINCAQREKHHERIH